MDYDRIPHAALLAAALFVASLVSVPVGPSAVHLLLNGLMGLVLGWAAFPAIVVALIMQTVFFGFGGLLSLGVNAMNLGLPALLCGALLGPWLGRVSARRAVGVGAVGGAFAVGLTGGLVGATLAFSSEAFIPAAKIIAATYLPLAVIEAAVTGTVIGFLARVYPEALIGGPR
jgi:cobalt/nickel transport system permease protein